MGMPFPIMGMPFPIMGMPFPICAAAVVKAITISRM